MKTNYPGIDYSGPSATCNRDASGIRYGIISANAFAPWIWDEFESEYWQGCGFCGSQLTDDEWEDPESPPPGCENPDAWTAPADVYPCTGRCPNCGELTSDDAKYGEDPIGHYYNRDGLSMLIDDSNDVWVLRSPLVIRAQYRSPCAPGACSLASPCDDGAECYAVPRDWFDDENPCPYPDVTADA